MLCKQDTRQSSNKLHDDGERAFGGGLRTREVLALHLGEQDYYLYQSCSLEVLALQEKCQTMTYTMGAAPSRIRLGDHMQEVQREINGIPLSCLHILDAEVIGDTFPDEHLLAISSHAPSMTT